MMHAPSKKTDSDEVSPRGSSVINYFLSFDESEEDGFNLKLSDEQSDYSALFSCEDATPKSKNVDAVCYLFGEAESDITHFVTELYEDTHYQLDEDTEKKNENLSFNGNGIKCSSGCHEKIKNMSNKTIDMPECTKLKIPLKDKCIITDYYSGPYIKDDQKSVSNEPKKRLYICSFKNCKRKFSLSPSLKLHQQMHKINRFRCKYCDLVLQNPCRLKFHESKHIDENDKVVTYPCTNADCKEVFNSRKLRRQHKINIHSSFEKLICEICGKSFTMENKYKYHMKHIHSTKLYSCEDCGKCFSNEITFYHHKKIHGPRKYVCNICCSDFYSAYNYLRHRDVHKIKKYTCLKCSSSFNFSRTLTKHMINVHLIPRNNFKLSVHDLRKKNHFSRLEKFLKSNALKIKKE